MPRRDFDYVLVRRRGRRGVGLKVDASGLTVSAPVTMPLSRIEAAVSDSNYEAFRRACDVYEEPVRKAVGRWIQRYPALNAEIGETVPIADIVEEVFLNAFEQFEAKPDNVPMAEWFEGLIDPALTDLTMQPDEELDNVSFVRTWLETARTTQ